MSEEALSYTNTVTPDPALFEQGSEQWRLARCGKFTASCMGKLLAKGKGLTRASYLRVLVAERLSGVPCGFEGNRDTEFGNEQEPFARRAYQVQQGTFLERVGFIVHPTMPFAGASPDGLNREERRGAEFKCHRRPDTFIEMIESPLDRDYLLQCQWGLACTGFDTWDLAHYCPSMPERLRLFVRTIERDEALIAEMTVEVKRGEIEVAARVAAYLNNNKE